MGSFYLHANHLPPLPLTYTLSVNNIYYRYHHTPDLYNVIETGEKKENKNYRQNSDQNEI